MARIEVISYPIRVWKEISVAPKLVLTLALWWLAFILFFWVDNRLVMVNYQWFKQANWFALCFSPIVALLFFLTKHWDFP